MTQGIEFKRATQSFHCAVCCRAWTVDRRTLKSPELMLLARESFAARHAKCISAGTIMTSLERNSLHWKKRVPELLRAAGRG